jgi:dUTP pyrophosphatase
MSELYGELSSPSLRNQTNYVLYFYVDSEYEELKEIYNTKVDEHNESLLLNPHPDSGFDLFVAEDQTMSVEHVNKVNLRVKCKMVKVCANGEELPTAFYMYPRSSISKQYFRLANNVGIIDSGYRGNLCGMFDVIYKDEEHVCEKHTRLLQICTPTLEPFRIVTVHRDTELGETHRSDGGFGSTGLRN